MLFVLNRYANIVNDYNVIYSALTFSTIFFIAWDSIVIDWLIENDTNEDLMREITKKEL